MAAEQNHPIDKLVAGIPGVRRVLMEDVAVTPPCEAMKATVLMPLAMGPKPVFSSFDLDLFFEAGGVRLACPSYMPAGVREMIEPSIAANFSNPQPYYTIGMVRCKCPPSKGGARWSPACVALKWARPLSDPAILTPLILDWAQVLRTNRDQFCLDGIFMLRAMGVL